MKDEWDAMPLGELCDVLDHKRKPITKRDRDAGEYPYYGATGVLDHVAGYLFDEPLVLVGEDGAKWGSGEITAFAVEGKVWVNNHAHVLRPNRDRLLDRWLIYHLNHSDLTAFVSGLTVPKLNQGSLREIAVPVPPLPEQQRIVALLDEAFAGLATAKANAERNLQNAREVFESHLQCVFSQRGEEWAEKPLGEVCVVKDGTHDSPKYVTDGIPFVTQKNIREEGLSFEKTKYIRQEDHDDFCRRSNAAYGDILISMIGANRGMACIVNDKRTFSIKNVGLVKQNPSINQDFLLYYLKSPQAASFVKLASKGGAQEFIGLSEMRRFPFPHPSLERQNELAKSFHFLNDETQRLTHLYERKLAALEELKQSLLQQAFNGEL